MNAVFSSVLVFRDIASGCLVLVSRGKILYLLLRAFAYSSDPFRSAIRAGCKEQPYKYLSNITFIEKQKKHSSVY